jgi:predicted dehydrogenase
MRSGRRLSRQIGLRTVRAGAIVAEGRRRYRLPADEERRVSIRLGMIGAGGIAQVHAEAAARAGSVIAGCWDIDEQRAKSLAAQHAGATAAGSLEALLARRDIRAVVIAVPNALHKPMAIAALRAGKDVLLEKPMAMNVAECDDIIAVMRETGAIVQLGFVTRFAPAVEAALPFIAAGRLGTVYHVKAAMYRRRGIPGLGRWFTTQAQSGGGALIDLGVHMIDLALHLTGGLRPVSVSAAGDGRFGQPISGYIAPAPMWAGPPDPQGTFDVEDWATGLVRFEGGTTMELNVSWAMHLVDGTLRDGVAMLGDRGACFLNPWKSELVFNADRAGELIEDRPALPLGDAWSLAWQREHEAFQRAVLERARPTASAEAGRRVQAIIDAMYVSMHAGREVLMASE